MGSYFFLQVLVVVFALSILTTTFNKRILGLPSAIGVPIVSAVAVFLLQWATSLLGNNDYVTINMDAIKNTVRHIDFYDFLINGVICFILTASALKFKASDLKAHWKPISILATLSLVVCAFLFGVIIFGFQYMIGDPVPLVILLLLGSALGATDPIGVKGVLASVRAPNHLMVKLEGESLFNDAMCIAVFMTILNIIKGGDFSFLIVIETLAFEIVVACVIGYAVGRFALTLLKGLHDKATLILITALLAAGSYLIALYAHASAPIACVIAGLVVGNKWHEIITQDDVDEVNHFWHTIEDIINAFLFTLIGLEIFLIDLNVKMILCGMFAFLVLHFSRFVANFFTFSLFPSVWKNSLNGSLTILSWGGVRGAISLALVLAVINVPAIAPYASVVLGYTFISVLLSGVVCGLGLPSVMNAFYYNPNEPKEGFAGWYQKICHKMNRKGFKYTVASGPGGESVSIYNPETYHKTTVVDKTIETKF